MGLKELFKIGFAAEKEGGGESDEPVDASAEADETEEIPSDVPTYYFVDFENVNEAGFTGASDLRANAEIHIFSTEYAPKIDYRVLTTLDKQGVHYVLHDCPSGDQQVDMHLAAYVGYLIGRNVSAGRSCRYVIISRDKGYDLMIHTWKTEENIDICRKVQLNAAPARLRKTAETAGSKNKKRKTAIARTSPAPKKATVRTVKTAPKKDSGAKNETAQKKETTPKKENTKKKENTQKKETAPKKDSGAKKETSPKKESAPKKTSPPKKSESQELEKRNKEIAAAVRKALAAADYETIAQEDAASTVLECIDSADPLQNIHGNLRRIWNKYDDAEHYSEVYELVRPIVRKYIKNTPDD